MIRQYGVGDAPAVRACIAELQERERRIDARLRPGAVMAAAHLDAMLDNCRRYAGMILVAEEEGAVVGFATVLTHVPYAGLDDPPGDYAIVSDLAVLAPFRRRGIGRALLAESERRAVAAGAPELRIAVLAGNDEAHTLYRSAGFAPYLETLSKPLTAAARG